MRTNKRDGGKAIKIRRLPRYALPALLGIFWFSMVSSGLGQAEAQGGWSTPIAIPDTYGGHNDLVVDSQGTIHVIYANSYVYHRSKSLDGQWSPRNVISADPWGRSPDRPYIHIDNADNLHVVWYEAYHPTSEGEIWYNDRPATLGAWEQPVALSRRDMSRNPAIATDSKGGVHVVGLLDAGSDKLLYCVKPSGGSWVGPGEIPGISGNVYPYLDIAIGPDDTLRVVSPTEDGLSYINKPLGGSWNEPVIISPQFLWYAYPRIGIGSTATIHVVWGEQSLDKLWYASKPSDGFWTTPISVPNTTPAGGADLALDAVENAHIVWADPVANEIYYIARQHADGSWSERHTLTTADSLREDIGWPHIAVGPDGALHVIWEEGGTIYYTWADLFISVEAAEEILPKEFRLEQNYPNPFNPTTTIQFTVSKLSFVKLELFDLLGREVVTLVEENLSPGVYKVELDASELASGVYFYRLEAKRFIQSKKLTVLK